MLKTLVRAQKITCFHVSLPTFLHEHLHTQMFLIFLNTFIFSLTYIPVCFDNSLMSTHHYIILYPHFQTATSYTQTYQTCLHAYNMNFFELTYIPVDFQTAWRERHRLHQISMYGSLRNTGTGVL